MTSVLRSRELKKTIFKIFWTSSWYPPPPDRQRIFLDIDFCFTYGNSLTAGGIKARSVCLSKGTWVKVSLRLAVIDFFVYQFNIPVHKLLKGQKRKSIPKLLIIQLQIAVYFLQNSCYPLIIFHHSHHPIHLMVAKVLFPAPPLIY